MMKKITFLSLILGGILCLVGYGITSVFGKNETSGFKDEKLGVHNRKGEEEINIRGTKDGVETFLALLRTAEGTAIEKKNDFIDSGWYNVTPKEVLEKTGGQIFKSSSTCDSFLLYEGEIYGLGISFGGLGVMDIKVCDFDQDGEYELLYTYSWGSGLHRSHVGHFDLKTRQETPLDFIHLNEDMMIIENPDGGFSLYEAQVEWGKKVFIDFELSPRRHLADLVYNEGKLQVIKISNET